MGMEFMNIIGDKILLRAIELSDRDILLSIINDGDTEFSLGGWSFPVSHLNQEEWIRNLKYNEMIMRCMIDDKKTKRTVGTVILSEIDYKNGNAEIHIKLIKEARGQGYGTDTIKTVVKYAFEELRLNCIYAQINEYNIASLNLFRKCGFEKEGVLRRRIFKNGRFHDVVSMSIINGD
jgi:RimJ/RimL family protein N-acetyltransferase